MDLTREYRMVRAVATPIIAVKTSNQPETIRRLKEATTAGAPLIRWDVARGLVALTKDSVEALTKAIGNTPPEMLTDPTSAFDTAAKLEGRAVVFAVNAHRFINDPRVSTAVGNVREPFKASGCTFVLLGPAFDFPAELLPDVVILSDPLPDDAALSTIVDFVYEQARTNTGEKADEMIEPVTDERRAAAVQALRGLSAFGAEQQAFLSLRKNGGGRYSLDMESLWARKIEAINAIPGLSMEYNRTSDTGIRGLAGIRSMLDRLFHTDNPERPAACLHIDEIDKALAGFGRQNAGDNTGITQDQVGQILQCMEDRGWDGVILAGPPGTGKTMISKTSAGSYDVPYVRLDLGALKGSLVGESEQGIRLALETVDRVAAGRLYVFATCNRMDALPPELRRRFTGGIWYCDLLGAEDRAECWKLYAGKYQIKDPVPPSPDWSDGWTGAEIRNVCRTSWRLRMPLEEARRLIVPVCESGKEDIERLRSLAIGRWLDAARGQTYRGPEIPTATVAPSRKLDMSGVN